jgi:hypothetical protein
MKKYYNLFEIIKEYDSLTYEKKEGVLWRALDFMQQYNGRTKWLCLSLAMGYDNDTGEENEYYKISYKNEDTNNI